MIFLKKISLYIDVLIFQILAVLSMFQRKEILAMLNQERANRNSISRSVDLILFGIQMLHIYNLFAFIFHLEEMYLVKFDFILVRGVIITAFMAPTIRTTFNDKFPERMSKVIEMYQKGERTMVSDSRKLIVYILTPIIGIIMQQFIFDK